MRRFIAAPLIAALIALSGSAFAENPNMASCTGCHGADGASGMMADVPTIAGIPAEVQEDALFAYLEEARKCWAPGIMCQIMGGLSEEDISELSADFAAMPYKPSNEEFDAALAAEGKTLHMDSCSICHGADDSGDGEASIVHGQRIEYLRKVMEQYAAGEREQPPMMQEKVAELSPEQIEAIINFYASYRAP